VGEKFKQGRYVVLKKLGWGHFSTVWLVLDNHTNSFAALKVGARCPALCWAQGCVQRECASCTPDARR
jgi:hypothetical protein